MSSLKLSIILPAYNEADCIGSVIAEIKDRHPDSEIIIIDDGSSDDTAAEANKAGAIVYSHPYNIGNGAAVKSGIRAANGDVLVFMDGDGQHEPADIQRMLAFIPEFDMVVGAREPGCQASYGRAIGNRIYNWLGTYVTKFKIEDLTSGLRAVKAPVARSFLHMLPNTYSYPTTITLGVLRSGWSIKYIPIQTCKRQTGTSNIRIFRDGVRFFMIITRVCTMYSPMRIFIPISFMLFMLGVIRYIYSFLMEGRFTNMSATLFVSSVIIFLMSLISEQICQMRYERRERKVRMKKYDTSSRD